jgi:alpha-amylase
MVNNANSSVFDFACYYKMNDALMVITLTVERHDVEKKSIQSRYFRNNHDTDEIYNKQLAYAYILTHEGYPTFYKDYEEWLDKKMNNLIWIHNQKTTGTTSILYTDNDEYIARRNGYKRKPGLVVYINNSSFGKKDGFQLIGPTHK